MCLTIRNKIVGYNVYNRSTKWYETLVFATKEFDYVRSKKNNKPCMVLHPIIKNSVDKYKINKIKGLGLRLTMDNNPQNIEIYTEIVDKDDNPLIETSKSFNINNNLGLHSRLINDYSQYYEKEYIADRLNILVFSFYEDIQIFSNKELISKSLCIPNPTLFKWFLNKNNIEVTKKLLRDYTNTYNSLERSI